MPSWTEDEEAVAKIASKLQQTPIFNEVSAKAPNGWDGEQASAHIRKYSPVWIENAERLLSILNGIDKDFVSKDALFYFVDVPAEINEYKGDVSLGTSLTEGINTCEFINFYFF